MVYPLNPCYIVNRILVVLLLILTPGAAKAQEVIEKIETLSEKLTDGMEDTSSGAHFIYYPTLAYTPETRWEFGVSTLTLFHARNNKKNRLSEINTFSFYTLEKQYGIWLDHAIYGNKDKYIFLGRARFQYFPLRYYGIGTGAPGSNEVIVSGLNFQLHERILRNITGNYFAGIAFDYHALHNVKLDKANESFRPAGYQGSSNKALGASIVYDNRKNVLNVRNGTFAEVSYFNYGKYIGSTYGFENIGIDVRYYRPGFHKKQVWAFQAVGQFNFGTIPFNQLALMGGESMMRGYYLGRYRDNNMLAAQGEYRFLPLPFSKRWGAAVFAGLGTVAGRVPDFDATKLKVAGGAGLRYYIFPGKDVFVRLDFAFTEESAVPGIYFFIGEAF